MLYCRLLDKKGMTDRFEVVHQRWMKMMMKLRYASRELLSSDFF